MMRKVIGFVAVCLVFGMTTTVEAGPLRRLASRLRCRGGHCAAPVAVVATPAAYAAPVAVPLEQPTPPTGYAR